MMANSVQKFDVDVMPGAPWFIVQQNWAHAYTDTQIYAQIIIGEPAEERLIEVQMDIKGLRDFADLLRETADEMLEHWREQQEASDE